MNLLGLDLATRTGFCHGEGINALPTVGHVQLPATGDNVGLYLIAFDMWLTQLLEEIRPDAIVFEAPFVKTGDVARTTRKLHALPGLVEMWAERRGLVVRQIAPVTAKRALTGHGNADKALMMDCARAYGLTIEVDDEADAFGVWLAGLRVLAPKQAPAWDFLFARQWRQSVGAD